MSDEGAREGEKLVAKTVKWQDKMKEDQLILAPPREDGQRLSEVAPRTPGVMDEQFPTASLGAKDERDKEMMAKLTMQDPANPGYTQFGKLYAKDSDFEWLQKKKAAAEYANFQQWFAKNFDLMAPAQKKRAKELFPEFYRERKKLLKQQAKNVVRLANLKLNGVENFDDLYLQYLAETGRLDVGPLQNLLRPESTLSDLTQTEQAKYYQGKFQRGLLSPWRVFGEEAYPFQPNWSAVDMRQVQQGYFADRDYARFGRQLGYESGFPPVGEAKNYNAGGASQVATKSWWELLKMQE